MAPMTRAEFGRQLTGVARAFSGPAVMKMAEASRRAALLTEATRELKERSEPPGFEGLEIGQAATGRFACLHIDMSDFTARSFWEPSHEVAQLSMVLLSMYSEVVESFGGYVFGLRGDGVFAGFGGLDARHPEVDCVLALAAAAWCLSATRDDFNNEAQRWSSEPVHLKVGADWGEITLARAGTRSSSELNPQGFAANFSAKCEKFANAWELIAGQDFVQYLDDRLHTSHLDSPKRYQRAGDVRFYHFARVNWTPALDHLDAIPAQLSGAGSTAVEIR